MYGDRDLPALFGLEIKTKLPSLALTGTLVACSTVVASVEATNTGILLVALEHHMAIVGGTVVPFFQREGC